MASHLHLVSSNPSPRAPLPPDHSGRWVASRKAQVVEAVECGALPLDEALARYRLSLEEFHMWQHERQLRGLPGLRARQTKALGFGRKGAVQAGSARG